MLQDSGLGFGNQGQSCWWVGFRLQDVGRMRRASTTWRNPAPPYTGIPLVFAE